MAGVRIVLWLCLLPLVLGHVEEPYTTPDGAAEDTFHPLPEHSSEVHSECGSKGSNTKDQICPRTSTRSDFIEDFPAPPVCGSSNIMWKDNKIYGGENAKIGNFPWMALLGYNELDATRWKCGGSLISLRHVLTAAHCIYRHDEDLYVVRLGELNYESEDDGANPIDFSIKIRIIHEEYDRKRRLNDIGLLVLEKDVEFTDLIKPICLLSSTGFNTKDFDRNMPIVAGWGATETSSSSPHLQVIQVPIVSNEDCDKVYSPAGVVINERVLCAGYEEGGKDTCTGDSGGPLMEAYYNPDNQTTYIHAIGVVSYAKGCAEAGYPTVYARVSYFMPWLKQNVLENLNLNDDIELKENSKYMLIFFN